MLLVGELPDLPHRDDLLQAGRGCREIAEDVAAGEDRPHRSHRHVVFEVLLRRRFEVDRDRP